MAGTEYRTVDVSGTAIHKEYTCAAQLSVGLVVETAAAAGNIQVSSGASPRYKGGPMIVAEAPERGKGIHSSGTTESTYAIGEQVPTIAPSAGGLVLVLLASGQTITRGGELEVNNAGKVIAAAGTNVVAFTAEESLSPAEDALILAKVLN